MFSVSVRFCRLFSALALSATALSAWGSLEAGMDAYSGGDYALAMHEVLPLAEKGDAQAQYLVGQMLANGEGVPKNETAAAQWFLEAAGSGNAKAQLALADMYSLGKGVAEDDAIAAYWRWRAATTRATVARRTLSESLKKSEADAGKAKRGEVPVMNHCAAPAYARDAEHFGDGGTVDLLFLVDADGKAQDVSVLNSSDWARLDRSARDAFAACTFVPGKIDGKPAPSVVRVPYVWKTN